MLSFIDDYSDRKMYVPRLGDRTTRLADVDLDGPILVNWALSKYPLVLRASVHMY